MKLGEWTPSLVSVCERGEGRTQVMLAIRHSMGYVVGWLVLVGFVGWLAPFGAVCKSGVWSVVCLLVLVRRW